MGHQKGGRGELQGVEEDMSGWPKRDMNERPYSTDELRVVKWLNTIDLGGGDAPIGFMLSSYQYMSAHLRKAREQLRRRT